MSKLSNDYYLALLGQKNNQIRYQYKTTNVETKSIKSFWTPRNYKITKYYFNGRFKIHFTIIKLQGFPFLFLIFLPLRKGEEISKLFFKIWTWVEINA